jgi:hypothetical protein
MTEDIRPDKGLARWRLDFCNRMKTLHLPSLKVHSSYSQARPVSVKTNL